MTILCGMRNLSKASDRRKFVHANLFVVAILALIAPLARSLTSLYTSEVSIFLARRFYHDVEISIPTLYNYALIIFNLGLTMLLYINSRRKDLPEARFWMLVSFVLFLMGYDEAASVHENLIRPLRSVFPDSPFLRFAWTPVGVFVSAGVFLFSLRFRKHLPRTVFTMMVFAGLIYLAGVIGFETLGGWLDYHYGRGSLYFIATIAEESSEMVGMIVFSYASLLRISAMDHTS